MRSVMAWLLVALGASVLQGADAPKWDFEDANVGQLPAGFSAAKTGEGEGNIWKVAEDKSAPSGTRVLAQTAKGPSPLFNLCIVEDARIQDLELSVAFKAVAGKIDQGGGVVWRYVDANNYYIARFNPLEDNFRLYKVVNGKRMQLATKESLKAPAGEWHTLSVRMKGDAIECSLNGTKYLDAKDDAFGKPGQIGLWTKADAQTYFDKLEAKQLK
jgi:hypothetical protein